MKKNNILIFILFFTVIFFTIQIFKDFAVLNNYAVAVAKKDTGNPSIKTPQNNLTIHFEWLDLMARNQHIENASEIDVYSSLLQRSNLFANMIRVLFPENLDLAKQASISFPQTKGYLYWVLDSAESEYKLSIETLNHILGLDPQDTVAWRRLGDVLWRNGEREEGLQAYLNACEIDDRESNGCYYVGTSYRALGDFEKSIYYFRKSYWPPSWKKADQLEAELSAQNP